LDWKPGEQRGHAGHIAVVLTSLIGAAQNNVVQASGVIAYSLNRSLEHDRREIVGPNLSQCATVTAHCGAHGGADEGISHGRRSTPPDGQAGGRPVVADQKHRDESVLGPLAEAFVGLAVWPSGRPAVIVPPTPTSIPYTRRAIPSPDRGRIRWL